MSKLLEVKNLVTEFTGDTGTTAILDHVSFSVEQGEILGIVGESGCGKSVTSLSIMGLLGRNGHVTGGEVQFCGRDLLKMTEKELDSLRGNEISMVFQDALASLNPVFSVGSQITESIRTHLHLSPREAHERAVYMLGRVGLPEPEAIMKKYPHLLSGGMRQRVMIAMALSCNTRLLIADEPTTALDVTIQAQIMRLIRSLQKENGMSVMLITHDIGLIAQMADRVLVMYAGQVVEEAPVGELFDHPMHPYTRALLQSVPDVRDSDEKKLRSIPGSVPEHYSTITGCRFAGRCSHEKPECMSPQNLRTLNSNSGKANSGDTEISPVNDDTAHFVRCDRAEEAAREVEPE